MNRIALIVLAAGTSRRFGVLDKLAAPVAGRALLSWTLDAAITDAVDRDHGFVVIGPGSTAAARIAEAHGWRTVFAHDAGRGMGASLRAGLTAVGADPDVTGAVILLGDDPVAAGMLDQVLAAASSNPHEPAAVRRTPFLPHPVYLPRAAWPPSDARVEDHGVRDALAGDTTWLDDAGPHPVDVDEPGDVERLSRLLSAG